MTCRLIVNADDHGRTDAISDGVLEAHRLGIVTSASLMVAYPAAERAARLSREHPGLGLGLHVALTGGPSVLPASAAPGLVDGAGRLPSRPEALAAARLVELAAEARAQLDRFRALVGRDPTHFDSHHHAHRLRAVFEVVVALALETGRPVRCASPDMVRELRARGVRTPDAFLESFFGDAATGETLEAILGGLGPGVTELMCHPARPDPELRATSSYADARGRELAVLTAPGLRERVTAAGIDLVSFAALASS